MFYYVSMSSRGARPSDMSGSLSPAPNTASIIFILHAPCQHQVMFSIFFRQICLAPMDRSTPNALPPQNNRRSCEITILSFSRSICHGELAALIGVTGKPYPSCLSCHSHPIRPCGAPSPRGEGCDTRIPSSKKRRRSRHLNPEP